jgi:tetratricopeptide (TPR) repeat protein
VVSERDGRWQADSGQYLLAFEGDPADGALGVIETKHAEPAAEHDWFAAAAALEHIDNEAARQAYERAIAADPARADARLNLGRLLHEAGKLAQAEHVYRDALRLGSRDPLLNFNLGVLLEDMDRGAEAMHAYEAALREDPDLADGHYNLALLYEQSGRGKDAIRHMARYRRLTKS